jgi:cytochrome c oxidase assembly protein subunit 16
MAVFPSKRFRSSKYNGTVPARYRALLAKHPFALFGLPFIATMVLGSFFLTPATAIRYEKHDRKVKQLTKEEELGIGKDRRRIDLKEEYYVRILPSLVCLTRSDSKCRDWQPKTSTTGSKRESKDYPASTTASSRSLLRLRFHSSSSHIPFHLLGLARRWFRKIKAFTRNIKYHNTPSICLCVAARFDPALVQIQLTHVSSFHKSLPLACFELLKWWMPYFLLS